ncbi:uncharacterized protein LOC132277092 [Cornus florida]|uniref:uncharacterized protein LOC132277092 n=1 Tax=Cornus florida TaxID=4283 RepID=UPI0028A07FCD|nr:uncharacterized protein LOC132277092 [Cornus florida]
MAESKPDPSNSLSGEDVKAPHVFERAKEEIEAIMHHNHESNHHHKETHGLRSDIDENTPISDVKAPNVFERAKEEIQALVQTIHPNKEPENHGSSPNGEKRHESVKEELKPEKSDSHAGKDAKAHNLIERAKEEFKEILHKEKSPHHHHKETHGMSNDIDENTPIHEVKGPSVFERAKEEVEALVQTIHPKKEPRNVVSSPKEEGGFRVSVGRALEKVCTACSPRASKKD